MDLTKETYYKVREKDLIAMLEDSFLAGAFRAFNPENGEFEKQKKDYMRSLKDSFGISKHKQVTYHDIAIKALNLFTKIEGE